MFVVASAGACSSKSSDAGPASPDGGTDAAPGASPANVGPPRKIHVDEIRAALKPLADARCQWLFRCCSDDELSASLGAATASDCADRILNAEVTGAYLYGFPFGPLEVLRQLDRLGNGFDYARETVDSAAVQACAKKLSGAACTPHAASKDHCSPTPPESAQGADPCEPTKLIVGSQKLGDDCAPGAYDCAQGFTCVSLAGQAGVCVRAPAAGDTCYDDGDCGQGVCDWTTGKCVTGGEYGEACAYTDPVHPVPGSEKVRCRSGLLCDTIAQKCTDPNCGGGSRCYADTDCPLSTQCVYYQCGAPRRNGERCARSADCANGTCLFDPSARTTLCSELFPNGAACQGDATCASNYCEYKAGIQACAPQLPDGSPCNGDGRQCASGRCTNVSGSLVCSRAAAVGDTCANDAECNPSRSLYCADLKCTKAPFDNGVSCTSSTQCKSEACANKKCGPKGGAGAPCGLADAAPCDAAFYCDGPAATKTCTAKKPDGAACARDVECWQGCSPRHGALRCVGSAPDQALCGGR